MLINSMYFIHSSFISDTIIANEYSQLGIMNINPSKSASLVISATCLNNNMEDDFQMQLQSSISTDNLKVEMFSFTS